MRIFDLFRRSSRKKASWADKDPNLVNHESTRYSKDIIVFNQATRLIEVLTFIKDNTALTGIELNRPATDGEIDFFEYSKVKLPQDFKTLYQFSNGFETDAHLFRLIPLHEIIDNVKDGRCAGGASFYFAEYMIYIDMWTVECDTSNVDNYKICNKADSMVYLTNSLTEFLCMFINKGIYDGLYGWPGREQHV